MRTSHADPSEPDAVGPRSHRGPWAARTPADVASLLLELSRALRGFSFYSDTDARRRRLADRVHQALLNELSRAGDLDLAVIDGGFELPGLPEAVVTEGAVREFEKALRQRGIGRLQLDSTLTRDAVHGFLELLERSNGRAADPEGFARTLAARDTRGFRINEIDGAARAPTQKLSATPPRAAISLAATRLTDTESAPPERAWPEASQPTLASNPLEAPANDDRGERLRARLIELDRTVEDDAYAARAADISVWAEHLWDDEQRDDCYRAMLVLADHAVGIGGRSEGQARIAAACFTDLASGRRLADLIDRATVPGQSGVRAAQVLLQLGEAGVPAVFERICDEEDPDRSAPLRALVIALGDASIPTLTQAMRDRRDRPARIAIRLAGELQNPVVLPTVLAAAGAEDLGRRTEAIRALSFLPGEASKAALERALDSGFEAICLAASEALAKTEGSNAVPSLLNVLEATLHTTQTRLAWTLVELLGRLGDERAVPRLAAILERKPLVRRAHWHAIQIAAIDALAVLPTREARRSIERAAAHAAHSLREYARQHLATLNAAR